MGRRGPAPEPTKLKILNGNRGHRPLNQDEPQPTAGCTMPAWLSPTAKSEWRRLAPKLLALGLLTENDRAAFAGYCQAYAELVDATRILDKEGRILPVFATSKALGTILDGNGRPIRIGGKLHPMLKSQRDAFARVRVLLAEFGLTPSARGRLRMGPAKAAESEGSVSGFARKRS
jgi:P27 family predicted phage terminase small subunit